MHKLNNLMSFKYYQLGKKTDFFYDSRNSEKNICVAVLTDSIYSAIDYMDNNEYIDFSRINRVKLEKITIMRRYRNQKLRIVNEPDEVLNKIKSVTKKEWVPIIYTNKTKLDLIKKYSFLGDIDTKLNYVLNNENDLRPPLERKNDVIKTLTDELRRLYNFKPDHQHYLVIPINKWVNFEDYKIREAFNIRKKTLFAYLFNHIQENPENFKMFKDWKIVLTNYNEITILDTDAYLKDLSMKNSDIKNYNPLYDDIYTYIRFFFKKCKSSQSNIATDDVSDISEVESMEKEHAYTKTVDLIKQTGIDVDTVNKEDLDDLVHVVREKTAQGNNVEQVFKEVKNLKEYENIIGSSLKGESLSNYKRNKLLKEKYTDYKMNYDGKVIDLGNIEELPDFKPIPEKKIVSKFVINENLKNLKAVNVNKTYNDELYLKDVMDILNHFAKCDPPMYLIEDVKVEDVSDALNRLSRYTAKFETTNRKRYTLKFLLPNFYKDDFIFINGRIKNIQNQKIPYPITKIESDVSVLTSNYNKVFIKRVGYKTNELVSKLVKFLESPEAKSNNIKSRLGDATIFSKSILTTLEYDEFSKNIISFSKGEDQICFDPIEMDNIFGSYSNQNDNIIPIGKINGEIVYLNMNNNKIILMPKSGKNKETDKSLSMFIYEYFKTVLKDSNLIDKISTGKKYMYTQAKVMATDIPTIVLACALSKGGLIDVLSRAKIEYEFLPNRKNVNVTTEDRSGTIRFNDGVLVYNNENIEANILLNGLYNIPTRNYGFYEFGDSESIIDILDLLYGRKNLIVAIENYRQLYVDPITSNLCKKLNLPNNLLDMVLYASDLNADNKFVDDVSFENCRLRRNEFIAIHLYMVLAKQYGAHRINSNQPFTIPEDAVIKALIASTVITDYSKMNIPLALETTREVKSKGPFGINVDETFTVDKRRFHPTFLGILGGNSTPSGEVGIRRTLSLDSKILDPRGFVEQNIDIHELKGTEIFSPAELISVGSMTNADTTRGSMSINQMKQIMPTARTSPDMITYGADMVYPKIDRSFSDHAKKDGVVIEKRDNLLIIKYDDGTFEDFDLKPAILKHSNSAKFFRTTYETSLKKGDRVKSDDIVVYDSNQISNKNIFGELVTTTGLNVNVAFVSTGETYEDAMFISEKASRDTTTKISKEKVLILSRFATIYKIAKVGDNLNPGDSLLIYNDTGDEYTTKLGDTSRKDIDLDKDISVNRKKVNVKCTVVDVRINYSVDESLISKTILDEIKRLDEPEISRENLLKKYNLAHKGNTLLEPTGRTNDNYGKIKGYDVGENILIEFVIEQEDVTSIGDKMTNNSAVKGTNSTVIENHLRSYCLNDPDFKIDFYISTIGDYVRMSHDINIMAAGNKVIRDFQHFKLNKKHGENIYKCYNLLKSK